MSEDIVSKFWRKWNKAIDKSKCIDVILDAIAENEKIKDRKILSMVLNNYLEDLYNFAYTEGFDEGRKIIGDNK